MAIRMAANALLLAQMARANTDIGQPLLDLADQFKSTSKAVGINSTVPAPTYPYPMVAPAVARIRPAVSGLSPISEQQLNPINVNGDKLDRIIELLDSINRAALEKQNRPEEYKIRQRNFTGAGPTVQICNSDLTRHAMAIFAFSSGITFWVSMDPAVASTSGVAIKDTTPLIMSREQYGLFVSQVWYGSLMLGATCQVVELISRLYER